MRYLLDTNIIIFILTQKDDDISVDVRAILDDYYNTFYTSSLSIVELVFLFNNGKIKSTYKNVESLLKAIKNDLYIHTLHTKDEHFKNYSVLVPAENHKDQIDHCIISQAICEKMPLVSSDRKFSEYCSQGLNFVYNKRK